MLCTSTYMYLCWYINVYSMSVSQSCLCSFLCNPYIHFEFPKSFFTCLLPFFLQKTSSREASECLAGKTGLKCLALCEGTYIVCVHLHLSVIIRIMWYTLLTLDIWYHFWDVVTFITNFAYVICCNQSVDSRMARKSLLCTLKLLKIDVCLNLSATKLLK